MIVTKNINIDFTKDIENIEKAIISCGINPLRWAIVDSNDKELTISVSYVCKHFVAKQQ